MHRFLALVILFVALPAQSASILVNETFYGGGTGSNFLGGNWSTFYNMMATEHDMTFGKPSNVYASNFDDLNYMLQFDALWLGARALSPLLTNAEVANLQAYIATGRKVVMVGENPNINPWNSHILSVVGGTASDVMVAGSVIDEAVALDHELTNDVSSVTITGAGRAIGGTSLFNANWATLWGDSQNVLTLLNVDHFHNNLMVDSTINDNYEFGQNIVGWIGTSTVIPVPAAIWLFASGLGLLGWLRRKDSFN